MSAILLSLMLLGAAAQVQTRETPTTRLFVQTTPPGAAIKLDGKAEGTAPKVFLVPPGATKMIVEIELDGHASQRREVTIQGGRVTRIEFLLEPAPPAKSDGARRSLEPAELDAQRAAVGDRDPKALHEIAVQRAQVVVQAAKADYGHALDANKISPGTVSESEISRLRAALDLAEIDLRRAVVGDRDPKALHEIAVQRAQVVVQAAKADYGYALDANKISPGTVSESEISRLRAALDLAEIDLRQAGLADPERNVLTAEQPAQPREEEVPGTRNSPPRSPMQNSLTCLTPTQTTQSPVRRLKRRSCSVSRGDPLHPTAWRRLLFRADQGSLRRWRGSGTSLGVS